MSDQDSEARDVQQILENLQEEIRRHRDVLADMGAVEEADPLAQARETKWVNSHLPIGWPVMPKGIIRKIVAYAKKITRRLLRWYINPLVDQQNAYNEASFQVLEDLHARLQECARRVGDIDAKLTDHEQMLSLYGQRLGEGGGLPERVTSLETRLAALQDSSRDELEELRARVQQQLQHLDRQREVMRFRLQRLENWRERDEAQPHELAQSAAAVREDLFDYFLLGLQYRGEKELQQRVADYDDLFAPLAPASGDGSRLSELPILDIGCGRGEFVEHLCASGLTAYGIEIEDDAVNIAQDAGRPVRYGEAFSHLEGLPDENLAAISLIQVAEHFEVEELLQLLKLGAQKLIPGGFILIETLNPLSVFSLLHFYIMDPSHSTPLHPQLVKLLMEQAGLWNVELRYLHPLPDAARLEQLPLEADGDLVEVLNRNIEKANRVLYGPQDYAAIAYKPEG